MQDHETPRPPTEQPSALARWVSGGLLLVGLVIAAAALWLVFREAPRAAPERPSTDASQTLPGGLTREQLAVVAADDDNETQKKRALTAEEAERARREKVDGEVQEKPIDEGEPQALPDEQER